MPDDMEELEALRLKYYDFTIPLTYKDENVERPILVSQAMVDEAVRLRSESKTYQQVADSMKISRGLAVAMVHEGLRTTPDESPEYIRKIEIEKYNMLERDLLEIFWTNKDGPGPAQSRALRAVDRILLIAERRAKLLGLDAPTVVETRPVEMKINGVSIDDI